MNESAVYVYLLPDDSPEPRPQRLLRLAAVYAAERGLPAGGFALRRTERGKPFFPERPEICFSLSHSGGLWAAAFYSLPLGVDIQRHQPADCAALARRWFSAEEYALVREQGAAAFFAIWCAKESWLKHSGAGIGDHMRLFSVVENNALAAICGGKQLQHLPCPPGYSLAVCAERLGEVKIINNCLL